MNYVRKTTCHVRRYNYIVYSILRWLFWRKRQRFCSSIVKTAEPQFSRGSLTPVVSYLFSDTNQSHLMLFITLTNKRPDVLNWELNLIHKCFMFNQSSNAAHVYSVGKWGEVFHTVNKRWDYVLENTFGVHIFHHRLLCFPCVPSPEPGLKFQHSYFNRV